MAYDEALAERIRAVVKRRSGISEKKMFEGLTFLLRGNMFCGVVDRDLMVRVGPDAYEQALTRRHAREMDFTGRPMKGLIYVGADDVRTAAQLRSWIERGIDFARSLPAK